MNAFEFGYVVGSLEKRAVNFRLAGNALATIPGKGVQSAPFRDAARQTIEAGKRLAGMAGQGAKTLGGNVLQALPRGNDLAANLGIAGVGGALAAGAGNRVEGAGRGMGLGAGATLGGSVGAGIGNTVANALPAKYRVPAQLIGGGLGAVGGLMGAGKMMGPASYAGKEAGIVGDMVQNVKDKTKQVADKATATAKTVANKTVDAGKKMQTNFESWRKSK